MIEPDVLRRLRREPTESAADYLARIEVAKYRLTDSDAAGLTQELTKEQLLAKNGLKRLHRRFIVVGVTGVVSFLLLTRVIAASSTLQDLGDFGFFIAMAISGFALAGAFAVLLAHPWQEWGRAELTFTKEAAFLADVISILERHRAHQRERAARAPTQRGRMTVKNEAPNSPVAENDARRRSRTSSHGSEADISELPRQNDWYGMRVEVLSADDPRPMVGHIVRADAEPPGLTIIKLAADGRYIVADDRQYAAVVDQVDQLVAAAQARLGVVEEIDVAAGAVSSAVSLLLESCHDSNRHVSAAAKEKLLQLDDQLDSALMRALCDSKDVVRSEAAWLLHDRYSPTFDPPLLDLITNPRNAFWASAVVALCGIVPVTRRCEPRVNVLLARLEEVDLSTQFRLAYALGRLRGYQANAAELEGLSAQTRAWISVAARRGLGRIPPAVIDALITGLGELNPEVQKWVAEGLVRLENAASEQLLEALTVSDAQIRGWAAVILGLAKDARAERQLVTNLASPETAAHIKANSLSALEKLAPSDESVAELQSAVESDSPHVRSWCAVALGLVAGTRGRGAVHVLTEMLDRADHTVGLQLVAEALVRIDPSFYKDARVANWIEDWDVSAGYQ